ncbi:PEP-CTERM sorting domain-containing protein [Oceaniferula spumae]
MLALLQVQTLSAQAYLDFDFAHGTVVKDQYADNFGVTLSAVSLRPGGIDPNTDAIVFDSERRGTTADADLQRVSTGTVNPNGWDGGNLGSDYVAGGLLILPENDDFDSVNNVYSDPDDNASGGEFTFSIAAGFSYTTFSTVIADFENDGEAWWIQATGRNGKVVMLSYANVTTPGHALYDPTIESGDNYINRLKPIDVTDYDLDEIAELKFTLDNSSGAIDAIFFSVPEPSTSLLSVLGAALVLFQRRRS